MINPILCIDDDDVASYILKVSLLKGGLGPDIHQFNDCADALSHLEELEKTTGRIPELIILDLAMVQMDGWDFLEAFEHRFHPRFPESKIVILTSSLNPEDRSRSGMFRFVLDFYQKPVGQELIRKIKGHPYFSNRFSEN
jgi:CheY-like chemotaxis protein